MELDLPLGVDEAERAVDADGLVIGIGDDDQRARAELALTPLPEAVLPEAVDDSRGQAAAAMARVGLDVLETGQPAPSLTRPAPDLS